MFLYTQHQKDQCLEGFTSLDKHTETKSLILKSRSYSETGMQASKSTFQYTTGLWVHRFISGFYFFFYFSD